MADYRMFIRQTGDVNIRIGRRFPLDKAADARRAMEERRTTGSTILIP